MVALVAVWAVNCANRQTGMRQMEDRTWGSRSGGGSGRRGEVVRSRLTTASNFLTVPDRLGWRAVRADAELPGQQPAMHGGNAQRALATPPSAWHARCSRAGSHAEKGAG